MKKSIITLVLALVAMASQAQEISKAEATAADYIKLLNKQGYQVFALDMSKFEKKKYLMSPRTFVSHIPTRRLRLPSTLCQRPTPCSYAIFSSTMCAASR